MSSGRGGDAIRYLDISNSEGNWIIGPECDYYDGIVGGCLPVAQQWIFLLRIYNHSIHCAVTGNGTRRGYSSVFRF